MPRPAAPLVPLMVLIAILAGATLLAQAPGQPPVTTPPAPAAAAQPAGLTDPAELEHFVDGVIAAQKEAIHVEGVTVAVVANGGLFFAKGYGFADRASRKRVDPGRTMFRIGSVSKLFTWTAVMQLVEQGRLDLKADVNTYLTGSPVRVPEAFGRPITMADLLTHTPGFEDHVIGLFGRSASTMRPLAEVLATDLPVRVRPPGQLSSVLQPRHRARRLHRRANLRHSLRALHRGANPAAAADGAHRRSSAGAERSEGRLVGRLRLLGGRAEATGIRVRSRLSGRRHERERGGHVALHARAPGRRDVRGGARSWARRPSVRCGPGCSDTPPRSTGCSTASTR